MKEPPASWKIGPWGDKQTYFEGSPQSLAGDLIREGVTGIAGHVSEPYLDTAIRPDILFPAYVAGFNLAEAFYLAMPAVGWQTIVIGDPLCAPFRKTTMRTEDLDPPIDPATEMPAFFSGRRFTAVTRPGYNEEGVKWSLRAEIRLVRDDTAGHVEALEHAIRLEPRLSASQLALALMYERDKDYDKAIERYRAILESDDRNVTALNNLAYALAVRKQQPKDALPLAQRAYLLTREQALTGDTLAWVYHLLGDDKTALPLLQDAVRRVPQHATLRWHLGAVLLGVGQPDLALEAVEAAIRLDPALETDEEVASLRATLRKQLGK
jgi:tetratricopeptide (TPR) repeat protein